MRSGKKIIRITVGLALLLALTFWTIRYRVSEEMIHPKRFLIEENIEQFKRGHLPSDYSINLYDSLTLFGTDNTQLSAYYIPSLKNEKHKTIIGLHDLASCKEHLYTMARWAQNEGINVIIFDSRAHGKSQGNEFTYGQKEHKDIIHIIDWIKNKNPTQNIGLWGLGAGASIAIKAMAVDERIDFAILENPYTSQQQLAFSQHPYIPEFIKKSAFRRTAEILEINQHSNPIFLAPKIKQDILLIHGEKHPLVSSEQASKLFQQFSGSQSKYFPVQGAHHYNLWHFGGELLETQFREFLIQQ